MNTDLEPKLAPSGSGLPIPMRWVARFLVPYQASKSDWDSNITRYNRYSKSIEESVINLTTEHLNKRILVKPITGLEDSSRYWSAAMVLDHLLITGIHFQNVISDLSQSRVPLIEVRVQDVKPPVQEHDLDIVRKYHQHWSSYFAHLRLGPDRKSTCHRHPWFGRLNAHQWVYVLSLHQGVHLQQLRQITAALTIR